MGRTAKPEDKIGVPITERGAKKLTIGSCEIWAFRSTERSQLRPCYNKFLTD